MENTQIRIDEPRKDECEAFQVVLLDGERIHAKRSGEIGKDVKVVRLGSPEYKKYAKESEPGKISVPVQTKVAVASQKTEGGKADPGKREELRKEVGSGPTSSQHPPSGKRSDGGGVRVIDLKKASEKEAEKKAQKSRIQKISDSKVTEEKRLRRDLNSSIAEGSFTTASSSIVSSYSTPFALFLNASNSEIGLLNSVQNLAGILSQLPGARLTRSMTRKRIWVMCTLLSRLFLVPLVFIGLFAPSTEIWVLIILLGFVSFFSSMRGPAWSSMMGDIVPVQRRGRYFGKRNMMIGAAGMVATLTAGAMIFYLGFPAIFAAAAALSVLSVLFFLPIREPELRQEREYHYRVHFHPRDLAYQIRTNRNFAIFTSYMTVVNFGVNIAAPFAAVYMLKDLDVGYGWFAVLVTIGALMQLLSMHYWGSRCDRYGNRKILVISGVLMCFVPLGYMLSTSVWHLILLKVYDGFVWGAFDLVVFNYLLAVTPSEKRPTFVANHNFMAGSGTVLGALLGGFLALQFQGGFMGLTALQAVFLISLILRFFSLTFLPKISEVEMKESLPVRYVFWETVAVGPAKGIEHAVTNAFRYPYGVKIKCALGLNNRRKIRISAKHFGPNGSEKVFAHIGVSPIRVPPHAAKAGGLKKDGVFEMALSDKLKLKSKSANGDEYVELGLERQSPKAAKIVVANLQRFSETDKVVKSIKAKNVVFVGLKTMKQTNMDELKQAVTKINRACAESGSNLSLVEEEWLIVTPQTAAVV